MLSRPGWLVPFSLLMACTSPGRPIESKPLHLEASDKVVVIVRALDCGANAVTFAALQSAVAQRGGSFRAVVLPGQIVESQWPRLLHDMEATFPVTIDTSGSWQGWLDSMKSSGPAGVVTNHGVITKVFLGTKELGRLLELVARSPQAIGL